MKTLHRNSIAATALLLGLALTPVVNASDTPNGRPFRYLNSRIDALQTQIDTLIGDVSSLKQWRIEATEALAILQQDSEANKAAIALLESELANVKSILATKQDIISGECPEGQLVAGISADPVELICRADMGASGLVAETVLVSDVVVANSSAVVTAECSAGTVVMGGSFEAGPGLEISSSGIEGNSFSVDAANTTVDGIALNVTATCIGVAQ